MKLSATSTLQDSFPNTGWLNEINQDWAAPLVSEEKMQRQSNQASTEYLVLDVISCAVSNQGDENP